MILGGDFVGGKVTGNWITGSDSFLFIINLFTTMVDKNHICIYNICVQIILKSASFVGRFKAFKNPHNVTDMSPCDVDRQISLLAKGNIS